MKAKFKSHAFTSISGLFGLVSFTSTVTAGTIYFDDFTTLGTNAGGPYTSSINGTATKSGGGTWLAGVEIGGWGQTGDGRATPTSSNFLAFTPDPARIYTVQATIDTTNGSALGGSWFTLGFTSSQHNWNGSDSGTIDTANLVRGSDAKTSTITYTLSGATLQAAGIQYVGWITDHAGVVNLTPSNEQVKITNFSLISGVANPTLTYNGNGSDGGTVPTDGSSPYTHSATVTTLGSGSMTRSGFNFIGWNTAADGSGTNYSPTATFTIYDDTTLYAKWLPETAVNITYSGNGSTGGSAPVDPNNPYTSGDAVTLLNAGTLTKASYSFANWNTAANGTGTSYSPGDSFTLNSDATLYAQWTVGPDYVWNNGADTAAWNTSEANWSEAAWSNASTNHAYFTTVGGDIQLDAGVLAGSVHVGNVGINFPSMSFNQGDLSATNLTVQGYGPNGGNYNANPTLTVNSTISIMGDVAIGRATLNVSDGSLTADRIISSPISADWGRFVVSGGIVTATNGVDGMVNTGATFALDLNGGTLETPFIRAANREQGTNNTAVITFNGGTLRAIGTDNSNFIQPYGGGANTYVAAGGAVVDTNGHNIGILANLLNAGGGGGLTKTGAGTLTLGGAYNYTGTTRVDAGTLALTTATLNDSAVVEIASTAVLNLPDGSTDTVADFLIDGISQGPGTWNEGNTGGRVTGGSLVVLAADPLLAWINQTWPTLSDQSASGDPDNDGIENLLEYILQGGDPSMANPGILPTVNAAGTDFIFTFNRRAAATGTTQTFQYSPDLGATSWTELSIPDGAGVVVGTAVNDIEQVQITVPKGTNTKLFGRLKVTQP